MSPLNEMQGLDLVLNERKWYNMHSCDITFNRYNRNIATGNRYVLSHSNTGRFVFIKRR